MCPSAQRALSPQRIHILYLFVLGQVSIILNGERRRWQEPASGVIVERVERWFEGRLMHAVRSTHSAYLSLIILFMCSVLLLESTEQQLYSRHRHLNVRRGHAKQSSGDAAQSSA